jgi:sugar-specific transcriptional regulator TrmB
MISASYNRYKYMFVHLNKQIITAQLLQFDLDEVEVQIYLALLENGPKNPLDLSRETSINRTKIYRYLDRLKRKRLVEESDLGRGLMLKAASPDTLQLLVAETEQKLKSQKELLPEILKEIAVLPQNAPSLFDIKHYHGDEGLKQMLWNHLAAKKELYIFGYQYRNDIVGKSFAETVRSEQVNRKIVVKEIENETDQGNYWYTDVPNWGLYYQSRYIPPQILRIRQYQAIFNNTISIMNWTDNNKVGIEITNESFANMYKQIFNKFWVVAKDYVAESKRLEAKKSRPEK